MCTRLYRSGQALYGVAKALYWKSSKRQISTHLTVLKHQNTKTSLYKLSENHRVFALFEFFGFVRKRLQFTVFNDHPVFSFIVPPSHILFLPLSYTTNCFENLTLGLGNSPTPILHEAWLIPFLTHLQILLTVFWPNPVLLFHV